MKKIAAIHIFFSLSLVLFANSKISFSSDKLEGSAGKDKTTTILTGNASVKIDNLQIKADRIELSGKNYRFISATGTVSGKDEEKGLEFSSSALNFDRDTEVAEFLGSVSVKDTKEDVLVKGERISYNKKHETMLLQMNIELTQKDLSCKAMFGMYYRKKSLLELTGRPEVTKEKDIFKAERITVNLDTKDITLKGKVSGSIIEKEKKKADTSSKTENASAEKETSPEKTPTIKERDNTSTGKPNLDSANKAEITINDSKGKN
ncbi:LptA/OstA family protein [Treponema phagedenis]|uniref:LptA/OstA family protein n=1 Tax=Treponema phagedenis TaxID=162 RepID=UPI0001F63C18|nr:LptA/OstA family protein [Treponema phagedenis]EFW38057.1 OstA-like protein [Treponema phagedenis F0421]TYT78439.1 lipopolysaccharide transporter LptA [Treponema phagedenis]